MRPPYQERDIGRRAFLVKALGLTAAGGLSPLLAAACARPSSTPDAKPDIEATVRAEVATRVAEQQGKPEQKPTRSTPIPEREVTAEELIDFANYKMLLPIKPGLRWRFITGPHIENAAGNSTTRSALSFSSGTELACDNQERKRWIATPCGPGRIMLLGHLSGPKQPGMVQIEHLVGKKGNKSKSIVVRYDHLEINEALKLEQQVTPDTELGNISCIGTDSPQFKVSFMEQEMEDGVGLGSRLPAKKLILSGYSVEEGESPNGKLTKAGQPPVIADKKVTGQNYISQPPMKRAQPPRPAEPGAPAKPAEPVREQPKSMEYILKTEAINAWFDLLNKTQNVGVNILRTTSPNLDTWKGFIPAIAEGKPYPTDQPLITAWQYVDSTTTLPPSGSSSKFQFLGEMQHNNIRLAQFTFQGIRGGDEVTSALFSFKHRHRAVGIDKEGPTAEVRKWLSVPDKRPLPEFSPWKDGEFSFLLTRSIDGKLSFVFGTWLSPDPIHNYTRIERNMLTPSPAFEAAYKNCYGDFPDQSSCKKYREKF